MTMGMWEVGFELDKGGRAGNTGAGDHKRKGHGKAGNVGWSGKRKQSFQLAEEEWRPKRKPVILWAWTELEPDLG